MFDDKGRLLTHAPSTYKIPTRVRRAGRLPRSLVELEGQLAPNTIYRSKAVGEPPLMLAISVFCAIADAIASLKPGAVPQLRAPATPEAIMMAVAALRQPEAAA